MKLDKKTYANWWVSGWRIKTTMLFGSGCDPLDYRYAEDRLETALMRRRWEDRVTYLKPKRYQTEIQ